MVKQCFLGVVIILLELILCIIRADVGRLLSFKTGTRKRNLAAGGTKFYKFSF